MDQEIIIELINKYPSHAATMIKKKDIEFYNSIMSNSNLATYKTFSEKLYNWLYPNHNACKICKSKTSFRSISIGYAVYCSAKCNANDPDTKEDKRQTNIKKYGVDNPSKSRLIKDKKKETSLKNYGVEHPMHSGVVKDKLRETITNLYGVDNVFQSNEIKARIKESMVKRYGVDNPSKSAFLQSKKKTTNNSLYGTNFYNQSDIFKKKHQHRRMQIILTKFTHIDPQFQIDEYQGVSGIKYSWKCQKCNNIFLSTIDNGFYPICPVCYPPQYSTSIGENEVAELIRSFGDEIIRNSKTIIPPFEIDIFVPDKKIAIEYCGLYWHCELNKNNKFYHYEKWRLCNENNIRLITIFEDEWLFNQDICISRLKGIFSLQSENILYGRQCKVEEVPTKEASFFLEKYHLQGDFSKSKVRVGLKFNDELVSIMTFGHDRFDKTGQYELHRYCSKQPVVGGAKRMFKYFLQNYAPDQIITYCDLRWGTGSLYTTLGFKLDKLTEPGYSYTNRKVREGRLKYTKKNLVEMGYNPTLTEEEIMASIGYVRIWDCGNYKFVWKSENA